MAEVNAQEFVLTEALLDADREFPGVKNKLKMEQPVDLVAMIGEVNLFESIEKPYITAKLVVMDDLGLMSELIELQGTERITLTIKGVEESVKDSVLKIELGIVSIVQREKLNDRASVYIINCVSKYVFADASSSVSRSYTGTLESITEKVLGTYLDVGVKKEDRLYGDDQSMQGNVKLILPYITPLEATEWLTDRATGREGGPFYTWASVWDQEDGKDHVRMGTFKTMITQGSRTAKQDEDLTFVYSVGNVGREVTQKSQRRTIQSFENNDVENTLAMIRDGAIGADVSNLDTFTSQKMNKHFSLEEYLGHISEATGIDDAFRTILDREAEVTVDKQTKKLSEFDGAGPDMITSFGTYEWENSYHDVSDPSYMMSKYRKGVIGSMLNRNKMHVSVSGHTFLEKRLSVGDVVRLGFDTQMVDDDGASIQKKDERSSGYYLIISLRHIFQNTTHSVVFTGAKVADDI